MSKREIIVIDLDGTIAKNVEKEGEIGEVIEGAKEAIAFLREKLGYKVIIETNRLSKRLHGKEKRKESKKKIKEWLKGNGIKVDKIPINSKYRSVCKFDDRGINVDSRESDCWSKSLLEFKDKMKWMEESTGVKKE